MVNIRSFYNLHSGSEIIEVRINQSINQLMHKGIINKCRYSIIKILIP